MSDTTVTCTVLQAWAKPTCIFCPPTMTGPRRGPQPRCAARRSPPRSRHGPFLLCPVEKIPRALDRGHSLGRHGPRNSRTKQVLRGPPEPEIGGRVERHLRLVATLRSTHVLLPGALCLTSAPRRALPRNISSARPTGTTFSSGLQAEQHAHGWADVAVLCFGVPVPMPLPAAPSKPATMKMPSSALAAVVSRSGCVVDTSAGAVLPWT